MELFIIVEKEDVGCWIMGGDFNSIVIKEERKWVRDGRRELEMDEFNVFIEDMDLVDVHSLNGVFTWFNSAGSSMSRLDRFLLLDKVVSNWKIVVQIVGQRDISDHCLVWLKASNFNWDPESFKFFNYWLSHKDFHSFVDKAWSSLDVLGRADYVLKEKLFILKGRLRWWNS